MSLLYALHCSQAIYIYIYIYIKTHDSESRGQEEAAIIRKTKNTRPLVSYLQGKPFRKSQPL